MAITALTVGTPVDDPSSGINNILTQEAYRIGSDIFRETLHTSCWLDLTKQSTFQDGMGYTLQTMIYDRVLPMYRAAGGNGAPDTIGLRWNSLASQLHPTSPATPGFVDGSSQNRIDPNTDKSMLDFTRILKQYNLKRAVIESPRINVDDLRFAAYRTEQLRAIMDLMKEATRRSWEERYRDEYERVSANFVPCLTTGTPFLSTVAELGTATANDSFEGLQIAGIEISKSGAGNSDVTPTANISNKILDAIRFRLIRQGAGPLGHGRENGSPVFSLILSSEASYVLQTEAGFRDDMRYNNAKVSDLLAPLGIEKSYRGFYHLIDDLAPRFNLNGSGDLEEVPSETLGSGVIGPNAAYETAEYEAAYVYVNEVMESLIPNPITGANGLSFDPVSYRGDFKWKNIPDVTYNPDGTIGFFRGILSSATKPIKTKFGYVILFKRTVVTPAA